ncbi:hypothetical protein MPL3365_170189 [Mesorhizobium plurifarium]|uniref:Uncharacterized protein n=1 Tax=Mesorhizobium plurifarium TaxID=69974 RepID=A0A090FZD5_MESPL|nr:hypothetical protein MPL3365_170189 [Mesorhizobium plurifarium]
MVVAASMVQMALVVALIFVLEKIGLWKRSDWRSLRDSREAAIRPALLLPATVARRSETRLP